MGEIAVANGDAAARGQQAVDRGHQAAEQRAGGKEADGCSLGHECPLSEVAEQLRFAIGDNLRIPDTTDNRLVCIAAFCLVHCSKNRAIGIPHEKRPPEPGCLGIPHIWAAPRCRWRAAIDLRPVPLSTGSGRRECRSLLRISAATRRGSRWSRLRRRCTGPVLMDLAVFIRSGERWSAIGLPSRWDTRMVVVGAAGSQLGTQCITFLRYPALVDYNVSRRAEVEVFGRQQRSVSFACSGRDEAAPRIQNRSGFS